MEKYNTNENNIILNAETNEPLGVSGTGIPPVWPPHQWSRLAAACLLTLCLSVWLCFCLFVYEVVHL